MRACFMLAKVTHNLFTGQIERREREREREGEKERERDGEYGY